MVKNTDKPEKKSKKSDKKEKKSLKDKKKDKKSKRKLSAEVIDTAEEVVAAEPVVEKPKLLQWLPKQLFVSGIPYDTTKDQLLDFFGDEKASITDVKLPTF